MGFRFPALLSPLYTYLLNQHGRGKGTAESKGYVIRFCPHGRHAENLTRTYLGLEDRAGLPARARVGQAMQPRTPLRIDREGSESDNSSASAQKRARLEDSTLGSSGARVVAGGMGSAPRMTQQHDPQGARARADASSPAASTC